MQTKITGGDKSSTYSQPPPIFAVPSMGPSTSTRSLKQRRVSLPGTSPLQSTKATPKQVTHDQFTSWSFRDEMGLPPHPSLLIVSPASFGFTDSGTSTPSTSKDSPPDTPPTRPRKRASTKSKPKPEPSPVDLPPPPVDALIAPESASRPSSSAVATGAASSLEDPVATFAPQPKPRKPRKRWTMEETQALVDGCNKWGVGNWKAILNDPQFEFQQRSPVDLKDRFRTYFPDAYRHHYPNAKTHLSSRVRSFLPDGTSIFEKTRSKKRRPFSAAEDEALRLGYEKHGTTWATIVKDPIFASQERRSTDLRDRFRNAFPELYKAAGYKPRPRASSNANTFSSTSEISGIITPAAVAAKIGERRSKKIVKGEGDNTPTVPPPAPVKSAPSLSNSSSATASAVVLSSTLTSTSPKKKRANNIGERPIAPGEPTALDFWRGRHRNANTRSSDYPFPHHTPISPSIPTTPHSAQIPKVSAMESPLPLSDSETSDTGEDDDEDEDSHRFQLKLLDEGERLNAEPVERDANGFAVPTLLPHKGSDRHQLEDDDTDMSYVDDDDPFCDSHDDIDGVSMDLQYLDKEDMDSSLERRTGSVASVSQAATSSGIASPALSHSLQDFLPTSGATSGTRCRGLSFPSELSERLSLPSMPDGIPDNHSTTGPHPIPRPPPPARCGSSASLTTGTSEDWSSIAGGNGTQGISSSVWLSTPGSPSASDYYPPPAQSINRNNGELPSKVGKSAWGPQDWLSNNPRLDTNLGLLDGSGALTSWPLTTGGLHGTREVFDRYDLYSIVEAAHDFASEADVNHNHHHGHHRGHHNSDSHTHSYPDDSIFRGFTHHRYAGDLIPGSGVAVHPPSLHLGVLNNSLTSATNNWGTLGLFGGLSALGLGGMGTEGVGLQEIEEYAANVASGSHMGLASSVSGSSLQDINEFSTVLAHRSIPPTAASSVSGSCVASPVKISANVGIGPDDGMVLVDDAIHQADDDNEGGGNGGDGALATNGGAVERQIVQDVTMSLAIPRDPHANDTQAEDPGARTPTSLNIPLRSASPIHVDLIQPSSSRPYSYSHNRPHSRSIHHPGFGSQQRGVSQPPSEHRNIQRSLSYFDSMTIPGGSFGASNSPLIDDPLAYNEPLSISSLDLQYGMSAGPNIFTPLTLFTHTQPSNPSTSITPSRTVDVSTATRLQSSLQAHTPTQPQPTTPSSSSHTMPEEALDLSALIHSSPLPASRNHHRHQSVTSTPVGFEKSSGLDKKSKRISWDGMMLGLQHQNSGTSGALDDLFLASFTHSSPFG